jgi:hypothetical protein
MPTSIHPRGGGFPLNKWGEIHTNGSLAYTKIMNKGARAPFSSFSSLLALFMGPFGLLLMGPCGPGVLGLAHYFLGTTHVIKKELSF